MKELNRVMSKKVIGGCLTEPCPTAPLTPIEKIIDMLTR
jgi:hypothetical protein